MVSEHSCPFVFHLPEDIRNLIQQDTWCCPLLSSCFYSEQHLKMLSLVVDGYQCRFCQQCGRFHELHEFDNNKRSCRARLQQHNARRRKRQAAKRGGGGGGANEDDSDAGEGEADEPWGKRASASNICRSASSEVPSSGAAGAGGYDHMQKILENSALQASPFLFPWPPRYILS